MTDIAVTLPAGWTVSGWRETSQPDTSGTIVKGQLFTLSKAAGGSTSVFVPNSLLGQTGAVQEAFSERIQAITTITG